MRQQTYLAWLTIALLLLVACTNQQQTLPTLVLTGTIPPTNQAQTPTSEPTHRVPATFPPTWTPASVIVETPTVEVREVETQVPFVPPTALEACNTLGEDFARNTRAFPLGAAPLVAWTGVQGAAAYHIALVVVDLEKPDSPPNEIFADFTSETTYTFQPDIFEAGKFYGWEVYPLDALGQQMCVAVGSELTPTGP